MGHFIFNMITGFIAIAFIYQLTTVVDILSAMIGIANDDYAMKLALFHTIFNLIGVIVCTPFIPKLVVYLEGMFIPKAVEIGKARYLNESALTLPDIALTSISKEVKRLFTNGFKIITHGINIKRSSLGLEKSIEEIINIPYSTEYVDIQKLYELKVKNIYGEIIDFSTKAQSNMNQNDIEKTYKLKLASRHLVEAIKDTKHLQKNIIAYSKSSNSEIQNLYFELKKDFVLILQKVYTISKTKDQEKIAELISQGRELSEKYDKVANETLDRLIRNGLISHQMATSFMNDSAYVYNIGANLLKMCETLFVEKTFRKRILIEDEEIEKAIVQNEKEIL
jgi:phosphate:Na+ symporter